ncbi:MAG: hypothetical protein E6916_08600 [Clostridium cochlearium]|uniref:hypothetical protein n=1 Tax=Clostridium cochlearium TaxID=1494 RepID=UPI00280BB7C0|nr:hypothetical protein [Clostridium cochlearium]MDU1443560.1 hypothetical protein [Clostridium cochlearium]
MEFELWIDESGDFEELENRDKKYLEGSLVGGVLCKKSQSQSLLNELKNLLGEKSHANEIDRDKRAEYTLPKLKYIKGRGVRFVVFHNDNKRYIVDSVSTYLNVFSEGIGKLSKELVEEYENVKLNIIYAQRKDTTKDEDCRDIILFKEYEKRIKEKVEIELSKAGIIRKKFNYSLRKIKANEVLKNRENLKVDIADMVCNTFLSKKSSMYTDEQKQLIKNLYENEYVYKVFQLSNKEKFEEHMKNGEYVGAITDIITFDENKDKEQCLNKLIQELNKVDDSYLKIQFNELINKLKFIIKFNRDNEVNLSLIKKIEDLILKRLDLNKVEIQEFYLELELLILEISNHMGNNEIEEETINLLLTNIKNTKFSFETLQLYYRILIRKAVYETNVFKFHEAIETTTKIIYTLDGIMDILNDGEINGVGKEVKSEILAKAYGTRLQARIFLMRNEKKEQYEKALGDSKKALNEFVYEGDKSQQYQYRSQLFTEAYEYEKALESLGKSMGIDKFNLEKDLKNLLNRIDKKERNNFEVMHLMKIVGVSSFNNKDISDKIFKEFIQSKCFNNFSRDNINNKDFYKFKYHPAEIILWNIGRYYINNESLKAALEYYDAAINICKRDTKCYTLRAIGLGILAEEIALCYKKEIANKEIKKYEKQFINYFDEFKNECYNKSCYKYFKEYNNITKDIINFTEDKKYDMLIKFSNKITY